MDYLFFKDSLQQFFSKKGNKPDRSKLEQTEKNPQKVKKFFEFSWRTLAKGSPFSFDWNL